MSEEKDPFAFADVLEFDVDSKDLTLRLPVTGDRFGHKLSIKSSEHAYTLKGNLWLSNNEPCSTIKMGPKVVVTATWVIDPRTSLAELMPEVVSRFGVKGIWYVTHETLWEENPHFKPGGLVERWLDDAKKARGDR
jgi:hypothetical protein